MLRIRGMPQKKPSHNITVAITALGKQKAEQFDAEGKMYEVLTYISESGPASIGEISENTHIRPKLVERIVRKLIARG